MNEESLSFFVSGPPQAWQRPVSMLHAKTKRLVTFTRKDTSAYEFKIRVHALAAMRHNLWRRPRSTDRFHLKLVFCLGDERRRDLDNLIKAVLDGLQPPKHAKYDTATILLDDFQVVELQVSRVLSVNNPGVWISVRRAEEVRAGAHFVPPREPAPDNSNRRGASKTLGPGETPEVVGRLARETP